ncbi:MAG: DUF6627 family protein [Gammaproteobacteria bacterium]
MKTMQSAISWLLSLLLVFSPLAGVQAAMIDNASLLAAEPAMQTRTSVQQLLGRNEARQQLQALGVSPEWAQERARSLSDVELARINQGIGQLEDGSDSVLGILLVVFIVFIITDVIGATDIFPFVHPVK